jgi:hypothetical protein
MKRFNKSEQLDETIRPDHVPEISQGNLCHLASPHAAKEQRNIPHQVKTDFLRSG